MKLMSLAMLVGAMLTGEAAAAPLNAAAIEARAHAAMTQTGARGLALAVIEDGRPVLVRA